MDAQLKKGVLAMCILYQLREQEEYGYEILRRIQAAFPDVYDGSVYAVLRRLAAEGYAETILRPSDSGPPRKYFRITPAGREYLTAAVDDWHSLQRQVHKLGIS